MIPNKLINKPLKDLSKDEIYILEKEGIYIYKHLLVYSYRVDFHILIGKISLILFLNVDEENNLKKALKKISAVKNKLYKKSKNIVEKYMEVE